METSINIITIYGHVFGLGKLLHLLKYKSWTALQSRRKPEKLSRKLGV